MDFLALLRLLRRQVWVVVPAVLLSGGLLAATLVLVPPTYRASSSVVLLNPPTPPEADVKSSKPTGDYQNPYARFGDLSIVVDILRRIMTSSPLMDKLRQEGLVGTYTVAANIDFSRGPIIDIASEASTAPDALGSTALVVKELGLQLGALQAQQGTRPDYFIRSEVVVSATRSTRVFSSTLRRLIAVGALGFGLVISTAIIGDSISRRKRRKSDTRKGPTSTESP